MTMIRDEKAVIRSCGTDRQAKPGSPDAIFQAFASLALLPPIFIAFAMMHGHLDYPFWDHIEAARFIALAMKGHLSLTDLVAQQNEARPATYRALVIVLAMIDGWNMRVEIAAIWLIMTTTFVIIAFGLLRIARTMREFLIALPALSALIFSPVAHNNQWWGMMLTWQLTALFLTLGFVLHSSGPRRLIPSIGAGIALTLSGFSLANGAIALMAIAGSSFLVNRSIRLTIAWFAVTVLFLALYFYGFVPPQTVRAGPLAIASFMVISIGAPLTGLLWYPFSNSFEINTGIIFPALIGTMLLAMWVVLVCRRIKFRRDDRATSFAVSAGLFAIGNSAMIGFGRAASDAYGVANANASRYSNCDAFLIYALLALMVTTDLRPAARRGLAVAYVATLIAAGVAYTSSWQVFESVAVFNTMLGSAYRDFDADADSHHWIFPNSEHAAEAIGVMRSLKIGPYRDGGEIKLP